MSTGSAEQDSNAGEKSDEIWNGWRHVESEDNYWGCGNNIGLTLKKGDIACTYRASHYMSSFSLIKLNGKQVSGTYSFDRSQSKDEIYNGFVKFIEAKLNEENATEENH